MEKIIKEVSLNFGEPSPQNTNICLKRNDRFCYTFRFVCDEINSFANAYAKIRFKRRNDGYVFLDTSVNDEISEGKLILTYDIPPALLQKSGAVEGEISIYDSNGDFRVTSGTFVFKVISDIEADTENLSEYTISSFERLINDCNAIADEHRRKIAQMDSSLSTVENLILSTENVITGMESINEKFSAGVNKKVSGYKEIKITSPVPESDVFIKLRGNVRKIGAPSISSPSTIGFPGTNSSDKLIILTDEAEVSMTLPNGTTELHSVPDGNGGFIFDSYDEYIGRYTRRVGTLEFTAENSSNWQFVTSQAGYDCLYYPLTGISSTRSKEGYCNYFVSGDDKKFYDFNAYFDDSIITFGTPYSDYYASNDFGEGVFIHLASDSFSCLEDFTDWIAEKALQGNPMKIYYPLDTAYLTILTPASRRRSYYTGHTETSGAPSITSPAEISSVIKYHAYFEVPVPRLLAIADENGKILVSDEYDVSSGKITRNVGEKTLSSSDFYSSSPVILSHRTGEDIYQYEINFAFGETPCMCNYFNGMTYDEFSNDTRTTKDLMAIASDAYSDAIVLLPEANNAAKAAICEDFTTFCDSVSSNESVILYYKLRHPVIENVAPLSFAAPYTDVILKSDGSISPEICVSYSKDFAAALNEFSENGSF